MPKTKLIKHIVMFSLKEDCTEKDYQAVYEGLLALPTQIPGGVIVQYELGKDLKLPGGQTHPAGKNRQIVFSPSFKSIEDYVSYDQHDAHQAFLKNILSPRVLPGSRSAIQYEVEIEE